MCRSNDIYFDLRSSNNPFAPALTLSTPSLPTSAPQTASPVSFNLQGTYASASTSPPPQPSQSAPPGPRANTMPAVKTRADDEHSKLASLLATREDGIDTFGNWGNLRCVLAPLCSALFGGSRCGAGTGSRRTSSSTSRRAGTARTTRSRTSSRSNSRSRTTSSRSSRSSIWRPLYSLPLLLPSCPRGTVLGFSSRSPQSHDPCAPVRAPPPFPPLERTYPLLCHDPFGGLKYETFTVLV